MRIEKLSSQDWKKSTLSGSARLAPLEALAIEKRAQRDAVHAAEGQALAREHPRVGTEHAVDLFETNRRGVLAQEAKRRTRLEREVGSPGVEIGLGDRFAALDPARAAGAGPPARARAATSGASGTTQSGSRAPLSATRSRIAERDVSGIDRTIASRSGTSASTASASTAAGTSARRSGDRADGSIASELWRQAGEEARRGARRPRRGRRAELEDVCPLRGRQQREAVRYPLEESLAELATDLHRGAERGPPPDLFAGQHRQHRSARRKERCGEKLPAPAASARRGACQPDPFLEPRARLFVKLRQHRAAALEEERRELPRQSPAPSRQV